jgi:hypothetical protein
MIELATCMLLRNQLSVALYLVLAFRWDIRGFAHAHIYHRFA